MTRVHRISERVVAAGRRRMLAPLRSRQALDPNRPSPKGTWLARRSPYAYVVVPKSGCTSAGQFLYFADHGRYYHSDVHQLQLGLYRANVDEIALQRRLARVADQLFVFTFVRDPYSRLLSGFLDKVTDLDQNYRPELRAKLVADWGVKLGPGADERESFRAFVRFVDYQYSLHEEVEQGATDDRADWQKVDLHWFAQWWYVKRGHELTDRVNFIGRVETMQDDLAALATELQPRHRPRLDDMPRFGAGPKKQFALTEYFDSETKQIVDRLYDRDFSLFGYPKIVGDAPDTISGFERAAQFSAWLKTS